MREQGRQRVREWARATWNVAIGFIGWVAGVITSYAVGRGTFTDDMFKWITNNGFAVVVAVFVLYLLRVVVLEAIAHFNVRLDDIGKMFTEALTDAAKNQKEALDHSTEAVDRLNEALAHSSELTIKNSEALNTVLMFISSNMTSLYQHRETVEPVLTDVSKHESSVLKPVDEEC